MSRSLEILEPGALCLVQDRGRPGHRALGISPSGALDRRSAEAVNRLLANSPDAAVLEILLGGARVRARGRVLVALTGAEVALRVVRAAAATGPTPAACGTLIDLRDGDELVLGAPAHGLRCYLGVRGGVAAGPVLGSRARDTLSGIGPEPVRAGDVLGVGEDTRGWPVLDALPSRTSAAAEHVTLRLSPGPRADWFAPTAIEALMANLWRLAPASDRIGARLLGPTLERRVRSELASEGLVRGAVQVAPAGPVVFLADHPTTGGYPVIGVVEDDDLDALAQARPGAGVRFEPVRWAERA